MVVCDGGSVVDGGVVVVPAVVHGQVDVDRLAAMLDERVKVVSLVLVPSQGFHHPPHQRVLAGDGVG